MLVLGDKFSPARKSQSRAAAVKRRECRLSEEITGWAVETLFPIAQIPDKYPKFPWRRIRKTRGVICGTLLAVNLLAIWSLELIWELLWPGDAAKTR